MKVSRDQTKDKNLVPPRRTGTGQVLANLLGGSFCAFYFLFLDPVSIRPGLDRDLIVVGVMTISLILMGSFIFHRWDKEITLAEKGLAQGGPLDPKLMAKARKKVLLGPYASAAVSLYNWTLAALFMTGYGGLFGNEAIDSAVLSQAARLFFGVMVSGILTTSIVFFLTEAQFRKARPYFFRNIKLSQVKGTLKFRVRERLLFSFAMVSIIPTLILVFLVHHKLTSLNLLSQGAYQNLINLMAFVILAEALLAFFLSRFTAASIADPVDEMEQAMEKVAQGDLSAQVEVRDVNELGMLAESFNAMIDGLRERDQIKETFGRFVSPDIAQTLMSHRPALGGEETEVTILFSDIRNYTSICEQMTPEQVIEMLNSYFSYMVTAIEENKGQVFQFVGDAIMAVFNAPVKLPDHPTLAVKCAIAMNKALADLNTHHREGLPPLSMGIGINTGQVVAGIIGSENRMEYRVVGDTVNLTARIESLNKELGTDILISESTGKLLKGPIKLTDKGRHRVKGKKGMVHVFSVET
ncbi:adenylate/guanylate cyclase domain-containing protein [Dethiosulfatarculus sandiegensis]|uniref:Adenylate cyclase n=1 Tax=Dethiosulfatarculus sandiegensis TaxID=1429043 RepID=A0A0D2GFN4_9BACT|nr:adenylate/guanylate cyclase domain-containing protein [Dethiosulfatarculus sandiegensis]KIX13747.1 adenylate cyclase [Dethiosulfatarculus sandiegensis]